MERFPVDSSMSLVIDLGDDSEAKTPLSSHRRKTVDRSVSAVEFVDSLQDPPLTLRRALAVMAKDKTSRPALVLVGLLLAFALLELVVSSWANSLCLVASAFFDLTEGMVLFVSVWAQAVARSSKATMLHSYGFERYEVIGRFGAASYFAFVCLWIFFEAAERILEVEPTFIHGSYLVQIGVVGIVLQLVHVTAFRRVLKSSSRSAFRWSNVFSVVWEFFADVLVVVTGFLIRQRGYFVLDTFVALLLTVLIAHQMIPIMVSSAAVLMQATPSSLPAARLVREISTLPGVLEVRKEHFWTLGGGSVVGTLRVRVRREVVESAVLAEITALCSPHMAHLTVQIEKDFL